MKILNLFAGIGGNRTLWGDTHEITSVEWDQQIAMIYLKRFPHDTIIIGDAYEYFLENFEKFDFVWASPPCTTHTRLVRCNIGHRYNGKNFHAKLPDFRLYSLIVFLQENFRGKWVVENVTTYYKPLIQPTSLIGRHYIWSNFVIPNLDGTAEHLPFDDDDLEKGCNWKGIDWDFISNLNIEKGKLKQIINNCVNPKEGRYILKYALTLKQMGLDMWEVSNT